MSISGKLKKMFTGLDISQEYLCVVREELEEMKVSLTLGSQPYSLEVTRTHVFLGYRPVIIALMVPQGSAGDERLECESIVGLHFGSGTFEINTTWQNIPADRKSVARLLLHKKNRKIISGIVVYFFEGAYGEHDFINRFHQGVNRLRESIRRKKPGNVNLPGNLYEQVRIAYAVPRIISVITVSNGTCMNMFPTDLHGSLDNCYLGSLRTGGKANDQVEQYRRIVISEVDSSWGREAYALGRNHMMDLESPGKFSLHREVSNQFRFPLPAAALRYRELIWKDSTDFGIHRIHLYEVASFHQVVNSLSTLAHVHQYYVQWRKNHGSSTRLIFR